MSDMLINGVPGNLLAASDRGLHYGDGLFETLRVRDGVLPLWDRHWRRLSRGCERLGIEGIDERTLQAEALRLATAIPRGVLKIIVTRGGGRGYRPPAQVSPTRIVARYEWPDHPPSHWSEGIAVRVCRMRLGRNRELAGMKHLNRLEQVLARREWEDPAIAEGLMLDDRARVVCGTMSNLFAVKAGRVLTPPVDECGVAGVMRGLLAEWSGAAEQVLTVEDLTAADEVLVCNAVIGVWPVRRLESRAYAVGEVARGLIARLRSEGLAD